MTTLPRWTAHEVRDWEQLLVENENGQKELNAVTSAVINYTVVIGVNAITEQNIDEVSCRIALLEAVLGPALTRHKTPLFITREDVARHVGLETEASLIALNDFWNRMLRINRSKNTAGMREANGGRTAL